MTSIAIRAHVLAACCGLVAAAVLLPSRASGQDRIAGVSATSVVPATKGKPAEYVGNGTCANCHRAQARTFLATSKGRQLIEHPRNAEEKLGCESCHGPGEQHAAVGGKQQVAGFLSFKRNDPASVQVRNAVCLGCHEGGKRMDWQSSQHDLRDMACTNCHTMMTQNSERHRMNKASVTTTCGQCHQRQMRSQQLSTSRMPELEGKMQCNNCHNPHGSPNEKMLIAPTVNETCTSCHMEKRGPVLWEHAPVAENCSNCHDPHGGRHEKLLSMPKPRLCQQCHATGHASGPLALATPSAHLLNRQCVNCHALIHGSNHPSGNRFQR